MDRSDEPDQTTWRSRPWAARAVRVSITVVPFAVATIGAWQIHLMLGTPASLVHAVGQWLVLSAAAMGAILLIDRGLRLLLPLPALLKMSLAFPEEAPSRFRSALRRGTTRRLERDLRDGAIADGTPQEAAEHLLEVVARLTEHDRRTRGHTERVRAYADMIADEMSLTENERQKLHWAALIHDIGKLRIPASVLNKDGEPSAREWSLLETHPIEGWHMLGPLRGWLGEWARATRDHHEKWDGTGYPAGRWGDNISRAGRIVAVADAYDVMTSTRSYKVPMRPEEARAELTRCAGTHFDPEVVRAFLRVSLRHQRAAAGPLSSLAQSPVVLRATSLAQVPATVASGALAATIAVGAMFTPVDDGPAEPQAAREVAIEQPVETTTTTTTTAASSTTTSTTTTTTSTTTLAPVPTSVTPVAPDTAPPPSPPAPPPSTVAVTTTTGGTLATVPPTTTALPPTTLPPPSTFDLGYLGGGTAGAPLVSAVVGSGTINWDSALNTDPGLTLVRDPDGLIELSAPHVMTWTVALPADLPIGSSMSIDLWVATAGFDTDALGIVLGGVGECTRPISGCTTIATGSQGFLQSDFGSDFGRITIHLDATPTTMAAGNHLVVALAAPTSSMTDVWIAYGTGDRASQLRP